MRFGGAPWLGLETVAEAPRCVDVLVGRLLLQCGPNPAYVHVYRARGTDAGVSPDLLGELFAAPQLTWGGGEGGEELEFFQAQLERPSPGAGREVLRVQLQVPGLDYLAPAARLAAFQVRVYAGDQLHHVEQDQVWSEFPRQPQGVGAAGRLAHPEAIAGEVVGKGAHDHLIVLDYQDLRCTGYQSIYSCWIRPKTTTSIDAALASFILLTQL